MQGTKVNSADMRPVADGTGLEQEGSRPAPGDCLLHLTHHVMAQECWRTLLDFAFGPAGPPVSIDGRGIKGARSHTETTQANRNKYKAEYERRLLALLILENNGNPNWKEVI
jgi:hypothetical protein